MHEREMGEFLARRDSSPAHETRTTASYFSDRLTRSVEAQPRCRSEQAPFLSDRLTRSVEAQPRCRSEQAPVARTIYESRDSIILYGRPSRSPWNPMYQPPRRAGEEASGRW